MSFEEIFREVPVTAIVRGIRPQEILAISEALYSAGVRIVEIPMNSPEPIESLRILTRAYGTRMICGAGTVLNSQTVDDVAAAGGQIIVAPNTQSAVISRARELRLIPMPGFATPTEAFAAYEAGARYLKLFPAASCGPDFLKQLGAVLPADAAVIPVGGITAGNMESWWKAGARGFGIGSELYRPGDGAQRVYEKALKIVETLRSLSPAGPERP
jgi:2-dehydro-3-deoxyphosphogalactonate aldolase